MKKLSLLTIVLASVWSFGTMAGYLDQDVSCSINTSGNTASTSQTIDISEANEEQNLKLSDSYYLQLSFDPVYVSEDNQSASLPYLRTGLIRVRGNGIVGLVDSEFLYFNPQNVLSSITIQGNSSIS